MATLNSNYQFIGRSNAVPNYGKGYNYYILLYAKTSGSTVTGNHTVSVLMRIACTTAHSFYNWNTTGYAKVAGQSAFSWNSQPNPNIEWNESLTEGGVTYPKWIDLMEGSTDVYIGYGAPKDVTIEGFWQRLDVGNPQPFLASTTPANASITVTLPAINGASVPTLSASAVEMGQPVTIYTNRLSAGFTHTLTYWFGNAKDTIDTGVGGRCTWTPSIELAKQIPSTPTGYGSVYCITYQNGVQIGEVQSVPITLTVPNNTETQPSVSMTLSPVSSLSAPFNALYIQGLTKVDAELYATGKYGATIKTYQMVVGGSTYGAPHTSGYLTQSGKVTVTGEATDTRDIGGKTEKTISVIPYAKPTVGPAKGQADVVCARCDKDGNFSDSGTYLRIIAKRTYWPVTSDGVQNNFCKIQYRCDGGRWKDILARDASGDEVDTGPISDVVSSPTTSYTIEIGVVDDIGNTHSVTKTVPTERVDFHLRKGGKGAAFGEYAEKENELSVAESWTLNIKGRVIGKIFDSIYPVGSIYMSVSEADPAALFGGTWERIQDRFLLGAGTYAPGTAGGSASHYHRLPLYGVSDGMALLDTTKFNQGADFTDTPVSGNWHFAKTGTVDTRPPNPQFGTGTASNLPPYLAVYIWKRIA